LSSFFFVSVPSQKRISSLQKLLFEKQRWKWSFVEIILFSFLSLHMHSLYIFSLYFILFPHFPLSHIYILHKKTTQKDIHLRSGCLSSALKFIVVESLICSFRQWMNVYIFWIVILPHRARLRQSLVKLSPTLFYCNVYDIGIYVYDDVVIKKTKKRNTKIYFFTPKLSWNWKQCMSWLWIEWRVFRSQMEEDNRYKLKLKKKMKLVE
jgi:hypothetical protein